MINRTILWVALIFSFVLSEAATVRIFRFTDNREDDTGPNIRVKPGQEKQITDVASVLMCL